MVAGAIVLYAISGGMLWFVDYNYDGLQGSPLTKLHPFTYFVFAALLWRAMQNGGPFVFAADKLKQRPAASWLLATSILLVIVTVLRAGPGVAGFIDTFGGPAAFALLLHDFDEEDLAPLIVALHVVMTINALVGLAEFASSTLLFPYRLDGVAHLEDTRSTSLQGHPLINAALTGVYVISLMAGAKSIPAWLRVLLIPLQFAALVVFGGRTGIIVALAFTPFYALYYGFRALRRRRVSLLAAAAVCAAAPLAVLVVAIALNSGLADRLLMRFVDDNGSAATRVVMFDMLRPFSFSELLVGPDIEQVESLRRRLGLEQGVENPFIRMILYQGALVMLVVLASLVWFFRELLRGRGFGVIGPVAAMAILLNASESISVKTNFLDKLVMMFVCMFPLLRRAPRRAVSRARTELNASRASRTLQRGPHSLRGLSPGRS